jgi:hypothetical protein
MPNWCFNRLRVTGATSALADFLAATTEAGQLRFARLAPEPDFDDEHAGDPLMPAWLTWRLKHWGTKWDLDSDEGAWATENATPVDLPAWIAAAVADTGTEPVSLTCDFSTAWSPPLPWLETTARSYPHLRFALFYEETGSWFAGRIVLADGEEIPEQSWQGDPVSYVACFIDDCDEDAEPADRDWVTEPHAPTTADRIRFCENHQLEGAVYHQVLADGALEPN